MAREIVINHRNLGTRVAVLEDRKLEDLLFAQNFSQQIVGNVYKGRVEDVVPGIQAAFVDIGQSKNVFLPVNGVVPNGEDKKIEHVLQPGQKVVIQIRKEATGTKGPKGSCKLELPGRYLIFLDEPGHIGVSRKLPGQERGRLRELAQEIIPQNRGAILRTEAGATEEEKIRAEVKSMLKLRKKIAKKAEQVKPPALIHQHSDLIGQVLRDRFTEEVDNLIIDTEAGYEQILDFVQTVAPELEEKVVYYQSQEPVFAKYKVNSQLKKLVKPEVELDCGGYLVIESTEALTAVDVNTGAYTEDNIKDTVKKVNLEAAREIPRQLRLRNISGITVVDFIGMDSEATKEEVLAVLEQGLKKDKTRTSVLGMTELGLVQITRKRKKNSIEQLLQSACPCCGGSGKILSNQALAWEVMDKIRAAGAEKKPAEIVVKLHPELAAYLLQVGKEALAVLEEELETKICLRVSSEINRSQVGVKANNSRVTPPFTVGNIISAVIKKDLGADSSLTWQDGWLIAVTAGQISVGQEVKIKLTAVDSLVSRAEILATSHKC